jgi:hypothetical protein
MAMFLSFLLLFHCNPHFDLNFSLQNFMHGMTWLGNGMAWHGLEMAWHGKAWK